MIRSVIFPALVAFSALAVSATAAFYSVTGLGDLFAGASVAVIIMASTLEFSKLIRTLFASTSSVRSSLVCKRN